MNPHTVRKFAKRVDLVFRIGADLLLVLSFCTIAAGQTPDTARNFWAAVEARTQLRSDLRLLLFEGLKKGEEFTQQQVHVGGGIGYRTAPIFRPHLRNIDPDKEFHLLLAAGYEFLKTIQSGTLSSENRIAFEAIPHYRPPAGFLIEERNRIEFRWVNGQYSTRYRNKLTIERDFLEHRLRFTPYISAEAFYDGSKHGWNEEEYAAGVQWPFRRLFMLDTYYLRKNCTTCTPGHLNVAGLTLTFYFRNKK